MAPAGEGVVGMVKEHQEEGPDAVQVWPGGERVSVAAFETRYPRGTLFVLADFSNLPSDEE